MAIRSFNDAKPGSAWDKWFRAGASYARRAGETDADTLNAAALDYFENNVDLTGDNARRTSTKAFKAGYLSIQNDPVLGWRS